MTSCQIDFTPIILAVAVQVPLICGAIVGWINYKSNQSHSKKRQYQIIGQNEKLLYIIENGFHGPPGLTGARGETGPAGPVGPSSNEKDHLPLPDQLL